MNNIKVYLASPFFNKEQVERIEFVERLLSRLGFDVFSPRKESLIKPGCSLEDMKKTFESNITNIDSCDFVLAILDTENGCKYSDSGTVFEFGYAFSKNKPVLCFNESRDKGPNLMLALSGKLPYITATTTIDQLLKESAANRVKTLHSSTQKERARRNLELILKNISKYGLEYEIKSSRYYQGDVE